MYFYPLCKQIPTVPNHVPKNPSPLLDLRSRIKQESNSDSNVSSSPFKSRIGFSISPSKSITASTTSPFRNASGGDRKSIQMKPLNQYLKKWIALSLICFLTDIGSASVITIFLHVYAPGSLITVLFLWHDVSMIVNLICMVGCFTDVANMLFPFKYWGKFTRNRVNSVPSIRVAEATD